MKLRMDGWNEWENRSEGLVCTGKQAGRRVYVEERGLRQQRLVNYRCRGRAHHTDGMQAHKALFLSLALFLLLSSPLPAQGK